MNPLQRTNNIGLAALLVLAMCLVAIAAARQVNAAGLDRVLVRFDEMSQSTATTGTVCARPTSTATEDQVKVTFPSGYVLGANGTWTTNTTNTAWPASANAWTVSSPSVSGQDVTFTSADLTANQLYCFNWTNSAALTQPGSPAVNESGSVTTYASASPVDTGSFATATIANDTITVTASVSQTFSFALSGTSDALGTLATGSVNSSPTPRTITVGTNAANGWLVWGKDSQTGLHSTFASHTIASTTPGSNSTITSGAEGYNTGVTKNSPGGTGTLTIAAPFVGGSSGKGGGLDTTLRTVVTSDGPNSNAVLTFTNNATIATTTQAATDYTDVITLTGAGLF